MFIKAFASLGLCVAGSLYAFGAFDAFPATVDGTPEQLMASLADLDVRELPGEPGTTAEAAGGVMPRFVAMQGANLLEWRVMAGDKVATRMVVTFEPVDDGARTKITPFVERGDAPDDFVSPAFRSEGLTMGLLQAALQAEIEEMTAPGWGAHCDELRDELLYGAGAEVAQMLPEREEGEPTASQTAQGLKAGLGTIRGIHRMHDGLMEAGCNPDKAPGAGNGEFRQVTSEMAPASPAMGEPMTETDGGWGATGDAEDQKDGGWVN